MATHTWNPHTWEVGSGLPQVQGQLNLGRKELTSLERKKITSLILIRCQRLHFSNNCYEYLRNIMFNRHAVKHLPILLGHSVLIWIVGNIHPVQNSKHRKKDIQQSLCWLSHLLAIREEKQVSLKYNPEDILQLFPWTHRYSNTYFMIPKITFSFELGLFYFKAHKTKNTWVTRFIHKCQKGDQMEH